MKFIINAFLCLLLFQNVVYAQVIVPAQGVDTLDRDIKQKTEYVEKTGSFICNKEDLLVKECQGYEYYLRNLNDVRIEYEINYDNEGKKIKREFIYIDDNLYQKSEYRNGELHGKRKLIDHNSISETSFNNGVPDGLSIVWDKNGKKVKEFKYKNGNLVSSIWWNKKGDVIAQGAYEGKGPFSSPKDGTFIVHTKSGDAFLSAYKEGELISKKKVDWLKLREGND